MRFRLTLVLCLLTGTVVAHQGVTNAAVMARMDLMKSVGTATKTLGDMAKGSVAFDPAKATEARAALAAKAQKVPELFEAAERDPMDEAREVIWTDWSGFLTANTAMQSAIAALDVSSREALAQGMRGLGQSCRACHEAYRLEK